MSKVQQIQAFLAAKGIAGVIEAESERDVRIPRDDIVKAYRHLSENEAYETLRQAVGAELGLRVYYSMKNDDFLWLACLP